MKELNNELHRHYALLLGVKSPWGVNGVNLDMAARRVEIRLEWGKGHGVSCPECGRECTIADHAPERTWRHLDMMQFETLIRARVPRSRCAEHGVKTISVAWAEPGSRFTLLFERFALDVILAARSLTQACDLLGLDWDALQRVVDRAVARGLKRRELEGLAHVGIDEKSFRSGQSYISLLSDLDGSRVLEVMEGCDQETAQALWQSLPEEQRRSIEAVALDMAPAFIAASRAAVPQAALSFTSPNISMKRWTPCAGRNIRNFRPKVTKP